MSTIKKRKLFFKELLKKIYFYTVYIKSEISCARNVNGIYSDLGINKSDFDNKKLTEYLNYWKQLSNRVNTKWYEIYSHINNKESIYIVPMNIFHNVIEAKLNNRSIAYSYKDKNLYELYYENKNIFPDCIIRNIEGFFYDKNYNFIQLTEEILANYLNYNSKVIVKPSLESGGGRNINLFLKTNENFISPSGEILSLTYLKKVYKNNYLIQKVIEQDPFFAQFNPASINTIRIHTYRSVVTDEIIILNTVLRMGSSGNFVDNQSSGGIACTIDKNGMLDNYALSVNLQKKIYESNGVKFSEIGCVPKLDEIKKIAKSIAKSSYYSRIMGFDFCVDNNQKIRLIEINNQYAGIILQIQGGPFFGDYTDEVVQYCKQFK